MTVDELSKSADIEVDVKCNGKTMNFRSEIKLIKNNSILINSIKVNDQTIGFSEKCTINFLYKYEGKLYIWENVNVKLVKYDGLIYHKIDLSGEGKAYNRRDAFRMYIGEDMIIYINTANGPSALQVLVKDISETGVAFITKEDFDIERTFRLRLKDDTLVVNLSGVIVRKEFLSHLDSNLYGCKFLEKNQMLGKFIALKQGEQLRNKTKIFSSPTHKKVIIN